MAKIKILFVVADFYQAGAQRFAFEIDSALDKNKFEIEILCLEEIGKMNKDWSSRYYEPLHRKLGTEITYIDPFLVNQVFSFPERIFNKITRNKFKKIKPKYKTDLPSFFQCFDVIHWMGEYTYIHILPANIREKSMIYSMTAKFQDANIHNHFDFEYTYNFISGFKQDEMEYEYSQFKKINHFHFPLAMKIFQKVKIWKFKKTAIYKIGIFTRLNYYKPLDPFFYSFQLLLEKLPNCELHVYGNGDPEKEGMINSLKRLDIQEKVFFRGHQSDIVETMTNEHINLSWFQGYNNDRPAGYAGLDVCSTGMPLICWDFFDKPKGPFNEVYPHYKSMTKFIDKSIMILTDENSANLLSELQFHDIMTNKNIDIYINELQAKYVEISKLKNN